MKPKSRTVLMCGVCGEVIYSCHECNQMFNVEDDVLCQEQIDGHRHFHKECV